MPQMKPIYWLLMLIYSMILWVLYMILLSGFFLNFYFKKVKKKSSKSENWSVMW